MIGSRILDPLLPRSDVPQHQLPVDAAASNYVRFCGRECERENVAG